MVRISLQNIYLLSSPTLLAILNDEEKPKRVPFKGSYGFYRLSCLRFKDDCGASRTRSRYDFIGGWEG